MRIPPALREPQYRLYALGNFFSLQGMWAQRTVIAWLAWELSHSASWVGAIAFLSFAPTLVTGPVFGVMADRADLKRAAMLVQATLAAVAALLWLAILSGELDIAGLALIALIQGVTTSAHHPVRMALTPRLAPREALPNAIAITSLNFNLARLTGPAWAGLAITAIGAGWTVALTVLLFAPFIAILSRLRPRPADGPPPARARLAAALGEGAAYAWTTPPIRLALLLTMVFAFLVRGYLELLPVMADGVFERGAAGLGALMAAGGGGALLSAFFLASRDVVTDTRPPKLVQVALFGGYAALAGIALAPSWSVVVALTGVAGVCGTMVGVSLQSNVQLALDDARRGRVMSLWIMVGIGAAALGAAALGVLIDLIGHRAALLWTAPLAAAATLSVFLVAAPRAEGRA